MRLELDEEQELLRESYARLFAAESGPDRVRAAEPLGFDPVLWKSAIDTGVVGLRVDEERGGAGGSLLDAAVVAREAGRRLASIPVVEAIVVAQLVSRLSGEASDELLPQLLDGRRIATIATEDLSVEPAQLLAGGAIADVVLARRGDEVVLLEDGRPSDEALPNVGTIPLARWDAEASAVRVLARGPRAIARFEAGIEEAKLLTAAALAGLAREALEMAGRYASERTQFGRPIGSFQGVSHPLADSVADVEGARLLVWKTIWSIAAGRPDAPALASMCLFWASEAATRAVERSLHTFGGYGLSLEYDIQLYYRRAKAMALVHGDPHADLAEVAVRLWDEARPDVPLPDAGACSIDFGFPASAESFRETARAFFEAQLDDDLKAHRHFAWEGHHPGFQQRLAEAGLLFPAWPEEYGGQGRDEYTTRALHSVFHEYGWTSMSIATTDFVCRTLMRYGSEALKQEVIPRAARGEAIVSLGYTEPSSGSDVAAARTRAVRDGEGWRINGQKMFTSGANLAQFVFLLTRTDPDASRKHEGLTMFLVPLDAPGIEIQPVHTLSDERTNLTYYNDVRIPDRYRVGEVDGGWAVVSYALELEHGMGFVAEHARMLAGAVDWASRARRRGARALDLIDVRQRLARCAVHVEVSRAISEYALYASAEGLDDPSIGPVTKFFSTDRFVADAADLMDLCAPDSLLRGPAGGMQEGAEAVEFGYRLSVATAIYGGTSEILKSIVAQTSLAMPRSRS